VAHTSVTRTQTLTPPSSGGVSVFGLATTDVPARPPDGALPSGEIDGSCPYIKAGLNIEPTSSGADFADLEGDRVQRVTRLTTLDPIGCRFYFQGDYHPIGDILPSTYSSAIEAHNAMVATAQVGANARGVPSFVPGADGVSFQTRLNAPDDGNDWAFAFAKGNVMVVVRTNQDRATPANAENIAKAIVAQF